MLFRGGEEVGYFLCIVYMDILRRVSYYVRGSDTVSLGYICLHGWLGGIKPRVYYMKTFFICSCYSMQETAV